MSMARTLLLPLLALAATTAANAQDKRPIAFTNARIVTVAGDTIERGTLVVRQGRIEAVGKDVTVPAGARVIDAAGKTIMPGVVSAFSRAGLRATRAEPALPRGFPRRRGRSSFRSTPSGGGAKNEAATRVVDGLYPKQKVFSELLEAGVTSLALTPIGSAFPGTGAVLAPDGETIDELTAEAEAFVQIGMERDAKTKKLLTDNFAKAEKLVEERKKPPAPPSRPAGESAKKPAGKPAEPPKPEAKDGSEPPKPEPKPDPKPTPPKPTPAPTPKPEPGKQDPKPAAAAKTAAKPAKKKDPNLEALADLLEGKKRAIVEIDSAADLLHWRDAVKDSIEFPRALVVTRHDPYSGTVDMVLDDVKAMKCPVLLPAAMATKGRSRHMIHPAKMLHDAGVEIGFVVGDTATSARGLFFQLMELVRCGLPAEVALAGVTRVPARALGIDARVGTLEVGKDANLIVFRGDPLSPKGEIDSVWIRGRAVESNNSSN